MSYYYSGGSSWHSWYNGYVSWYAMYEALHQPTDQENLNSLEEQDTEYYTGAYNDLEDSEDTAYYSGAYDNSQYSQEQDTEYYTGAYDNFNNSDDPEGFLLDADYVQYFENNGGENSNNSDDGEFDEDRPYDIPSQPYDDVPDEDTPPPYGFVDEDDDRSFDEIRYQAYVESGGPDDSLGENIVPYDDLPDDSDGEDVEIEPDNSEDQEIEGDPFDPENIEVDDSEDDSENDDTEFQEITFEPEGELLGPNTWQEQLMEDNEIPEGLVWLEEIIDEITGENQLEGGAGSVDLDPFNNNNMEWSDLDLDIGDQNNEINENPGGAEGGLDFNYDELGKYGDDLTQEEAEEPRSEEEEDPDIDLSNYPEDDGGDPEPDEQNEDDAFDDEADFNEFLDDLGIEQDQELAEEESLPENNDQNENEELDVEEEEEEPYVPDQDKLDEIRNRFKGTRRNYNEFLLSDEGKGVAENFGQLLNDYISPSGEFDLSQRDALTNELANFMTDGGFEGLDAFALSVNLLEGLIGTDLMDVPNVGHFVNNLLDEFVPSDALDRLEGIVPDFVERMTGLDAVLSGSDLPTGYLGQDFNLRNYLFGDMDMIGEINFGLNPSTSQLEQQELDYLTELLGSEDLARNALTEAVDPNDPNFLSQITNFVADTAGGAYDFLESVGDRIGFTQQSYLGGEIPTQALNYLGAVMAGIPVGSILNYLGDAMAPTGQDLSDYLADVVGVDPTTATIEDINPYLSDLGYDPIPPIDPSTGEFIINDGEGRDSAIDDIVAGIDLTPGEGEFPVIADLGGLPEAVGNGSIISSVGEGTGNEFDYGTDANPLGGNDNDGILDNIGDAVNGLIGDVISEDTSLGEAGNELVNNASDTITEVLEFGNGRADANDTEIDQDFVDSTIEIHNETISRDADLDEDGEADTETGIAVDSGGNIDTNMDEDTNTGTGTNLGDEYDAAYETAKYLIGASGAEAYRGAGMSNPALLEIINQYASDISQDELARLIDLNRGEQVGINELRDVQRASDLELIGNYGSSFADAVRGLDPTSMSILGDQKSLSDRLYRRAAGDLTAEEEADAAERAFEIAAMSGRTLDSTRVANTIRSEEDFRTGLENRAQAAGSLGYNMSRNITGDIPGLLLGTGNSPYGTGVGNVVAPFGVADAVSLGTNSYQQQQEYDKVQRQLTDLTQQYNTANEANDISTAQRVASQIQEVEAYANILMGGLNFASNLPTYGQNVGDAFKGAVSGVKDTFDFFGGLLGGNRGSTNTSSFTSSPSRGSNFSSGSSSRFGGYSLSDIMDGF
jgi:hypothetical protein